MKNMRIKAVLFAACAIGYTSLSATAAVTANIIANAAGAGFYKTASGDALPSGSLLRVGTLNLAAFNLLSTTQQADYATVNALFTEIATVTASATGTFLKTGEVITGEAAQGAQLYTWVFNAATAGAATQYGIFSSNNALWKVPADPGSATLSNANFTGSSGQNLFGTGFQATGTGTGTNALLKSLTVVPEPSAALLGAIGALGLLRRRRI